MEKRSLRYLYLWLAVAILAATIAVGFSVWFRLLRLHVELGPFFYHHWFVWFGVSFIGIYLPIYSILKRRLKKTRLLFHIHVIGNLVAFLFISIHFILQLSRSAESRPQLGTGLTLIITILILVITGALRFFHIGKKYRDIYSFIHVSVTSAFYIIIFIHILIGLEIF